MNAAEIRQVTLDYCEADGPGRNVQDCALFLREIAAQLAELNQNPAPDSWRDADQARLGRRWPVIDLDSKPLAARGAMIALGLSFVFWTIIFFAWRWFHVR